MKIDWRAGKELLSLDRYKKADTAYHCLRGGNYSPTCSADVLHFVLFCTPGIKALSVYGDSPLHAPVFRCSLDQSITCHGAGTFELSVGSTFADIELGISNSVLNQGYAAAVHGNRTKENGYTLLHNNGTKVWYTLLSPLNIIVCISSRSDLAKFSRQAGLVACLSLSGRAECTSFQRTSEFGPGLVWKVRKIKLLLV